MKKKLILLLLLAMPIVGKCYYCDYNDLAKYKKIASNITYSYEYLESESSVLFKVTLSNLDSTLYLKDNYSNVYNYTQDEIIVDGVSGENKTIYVYPTDPFCEDKSIYTINIQLPTYNVYYKDSVCTGVENFNLCQKWSTHNLSYDKFVEKVEAYKKSFNKPVIEEEKNESLLDYLIVFLIKYYYVILILIIVISSTTIYFINKKSDIYK